MFLQILLFSSSSSAAAVFSLRPAKADAGDRTSHLQEKNGRKEKRVRFSGKHCFFRRDNSTNLAQVSEIRVVPNIFNIQENDWHHLCLIAPHEIFAALAGGQIEHICRSFFFLELNSIPLVALIETLYLLRLRWESALVVAEEARVRLNRPVTGEAHLEAGVGIR